MVNPLVAGTHAPPIPEVQAWGQAYDGGCGPLIDLCQAVPGYQPPAELLARLGAAAADPALAKYGPIAGEPGLRAAYARQVGVDPGQVLITAGCNQAVFAALLALVPRGASVLLPTPWYFNHKMTCDMLGLVARPLPCLASAGFIPDPAQAATLLDGVAAVVLVTPNNPTGAIYPAEMLAQFAALCRDRGVTLILDETYRDFAPQPVATPADAIRLYSFSKAYAVPGHRVGAMVLPEALVPQLLKVLDCLHICPQRPAQQALAWAIGALAEWRCDNREEMARRAIAIAAAFAGLPGWRIDSLGAYFAYLRHPFRGVPAWAVTEHLACRHGVLLLPGPAFAGSEDHLRLSFANVDAAGIAALASRLAEMRAPAVAA